jgi:hypothetical protein
MKKIKFRVLTFSLLFPIIAGSLVNCGGSTSFTTISISPASTTIATGSQTTQQFTASETLDDNSMTLNMSSLVTWNSSRPDVASIPALYYNANNSPVGQSTLSLTPGTTTITATDTTNRLSASATLTIANPSALNVTPQATLLVPSKLYIAAGGYQHQFFAFATLSTNPLITQNLAAVDLTAGDPLSKWGKTTWSSDDPTTASVSTTGLVTTALTYAATPVNISAQYDYNGTTLISTTSIPLTLIANNLVSLVIDQSSPQTIHLSGPLTLSLTATGTCNGICIGAANTLNYTSAVVWSSSDSTNAPIIQTGVGAGTVTAVAVGTYTITAFDPITSASSSITLIIDAN